MCASVARAAKVEGERFPSATRRRADWMARACCWRMRGVWGGGGGWGVRGWMGGVRGWMGGSGWGGMGGERVDGGRVDGWGWMGGGGG